MKGRKSMLTVLLCLFFSVINQADGQLAELRDLQGPYSGYGQVKNSELISFIQAFTNAKDSALIQRFYLEHQETREAYLFFVKTSIPAYAKDMGFSGDTFGITSQNLDSFLLAEKKVNAEKLVQFVKNCKDCHTVYEIFGYPVTTKLYKTVHADGDVIDMELQLGRRKTDDKSVSFRIYRFQQKWVIRSLYARSGWKKEE